MKCFLIDPVARHISVENLEWDITMGYHALNHMIYTMGQYTAFDSFMINQEGDRCYLDDSGLLRGDLIIWHWIGYHHPLAGRGVVLGTRGEDTCAPRISLETLRRHVVFIP